MPIYITQGRYTRDAIKGMIVKPEDQQQPTSYRLSSQPAESDCRRIRFKPAE